MRVTAKEWAEQNECNLSTAFNTLNKMVARGEAIKVGFNPIVFEFTFTNGSSIEVNDPFNLFAREVEPMPPNAWLQRGEA